MQSKSAVSNIKMSQYRSNFYNIYHQKIAPILLTFEKERKNKLFKLCFLEVVIVSFFVMSVYSFYTLEYAAMDTVSQLISTFAPLVALASFIGGIALPINYNKKFVTKLKMTCMPKILAAFGQMNWIEGTPLNSDDELSESYLFSMYNRRASYDSFSGVYKDLKFNIDETFLCHESGAGKTRRIVTVFRGVIIKFPSNKNVQNTTIIATRGDRNIKNKGALGVIGFIVSLFYMFPYYQLWTMKNMIFLVIALGFLFFVYSLFRRVQGDPARQILKEMKLEDPEFSKKYVAYSSNQVEGRYLITPAFMERFKNLQTAFGAKKAKCSFYGNNLMFAISTNKNLFEIGCLFRSLDNPKQMTEFFNEFSSIIALVDYFKLDEKTGL